MGAFSKLFGGGSSAPAYTPYSTSSGLGAVNIEGNQITGSVAGPYAELIRQLQGGFGGVQPSLSPEQLALGAGATEAGAGFLGALKAYDPFAATEEQFSRLEAILEPGRQRQRTSLQENLLRTGRLGSTGGGVSEQSLESAIEESRRANLAGAFESAMGAQSQLANLGTGLGAFGGSVEDQQFQRMLQGLGTATSLEAMPFELSQLGTSLSGQRSQHELERAKQQGSGDFLGGLASSALAAYTGGLGNVALAALQKKQEPTGGAGFLAGEGDFRGSPWGTVNPYLNLGLK